MKVEAMHQELGTNVTTETTTAAMPQAAPGVRRLRRLAMIVLGMALLVYATSGALAKPQTTAAVGQRNDLIADGVTDGRVKLMINRSVVVSTKTPYKRVSVGN